MIEGRCSSRLSLLGCEHSTGGRTFSVWIEQLDIRGFKRLQGEYELSRRLTVFHGVNEAGKSSLHEALTRTLCGFSSGERRRYGGESELERCAPWNGNPFAINATVHTQDRRVRI